jgi:Tol biopolymer transport system component
LAYVQSVIRENLQRVGFDPTTETVVGQPTWITQGSKLATRPDLSPDGEWLAFDAQGEKQEDLFVIRKDGTGLRQLTDDPAKDRRPRWSPDGKRIAFASDRSGKYEIWTISPDGSGLQQITYASDGVLYCIWSPDGTRLAYTTQRGSTSIIEADKPWKEQSPQALPPMSDPNRWFNVWSWSPDGRRLAGIQQREGVLSTGLFLYSLESRQYEQLTDSGSRPVWLSDSRRLLASFDNKLSVVDSQSKKVHDVLSVAPNVMGGLALSRDNRLIYFSLRTTEADIWLMTLE